MRGFGLNLELGLTSGGPKVVTPSTVASISPAVGEIAGGMAVTLTGTLLSTVTAVTIGGTACTSVVAVNATTVTCVTPAKAAGTYDVVATGPGGVTATLAAGFQAVDLHALGAGSLVLDLNADNVPGADGALPTTWTDESGLGHTANLGGGSTLKKAILGTNAKAVIRFITSGFAEVNSIASIVSGTDLPVTIVMAMAYRTPGAGAGILASFSNAGSALPFLAAVQETTKWSTDHRDDLGTRVNTGRGASNSNAHILILRFTGTTMTIQVDGVDSVGDPVTDNLGAMTVDQFTIAAWKLGGVVPNSFAPLDLNRMLVYSSALSAPDTAAAKNALAAIVGITVV